jgi:CRISPR-associated protein Cas1
MIGKIVDISGTPRRLSLFRGFLIVAEEDRELGRVALDDIAGLIVDSHGCTVSTQILGALAEAGVPVVICGNNHAPAGVFWPVEAHHAQTARAAGQLAASKALNNAVWREITREKIRQQAACLDRTGMEGGKSLRFLIAKVRPNDPDNIEAQAAARYWRFLFGDDFRRDRSSGGVNAMLNYGYGVLRAAVARGVMATGLTPSIGVHHRSGVNPLVLVDDLMEPFRPMIDEVVWWMAHEGIRELDNTGKRRLGEVLFDEVTWYGAKSPLQNAIYHAAELLAAAYAGESVFGIKYDLSRRRPPNNEC